MKDFILLKHTDKSILDERVQKYLKNNGVCIGNVYESRNQYFQIIGSR